MTVPLVMRRGRRQLASASMSSPHAEAHADKCIDEALSSQMFIVLPKSAKRTICYTFGNINLTHRCE